MSEFFKPVRLGERDRREGGRSAQSTASKLTDRNRFSRRRSNDPRPPVLVTKLDPASVAAEAFRTLRTNLEFSRGDRPVRNIVVTSPTAGAGKSTTAANLAVAAAQAGSRVCLVDADLRRPVLHDAFAIPNTGGLAAMLRGGLPFSGAARDTAIQNLSLVVSGATHGISQGLITTERLQKLFAEAGNEFDLVIYDTAPVLLIADTVNMTALCDGVILVVRWGSIPGSVLKRAVQQITQVNGRILGVLLNQVNLRRSDDDVYRYYRAYYGEKSRN